MVIPPELGRHFVGKPGTSFMDFNPPRVWVSLKKHVECPKTLQNQNPSMTPNLDGLLQSHLMRVNGFHLTINRPPNQSQQQPRCFHFGWGLKSSVLCKKKTKNRERLLVSLNGRIARSMILLKSTFLHIRNVRLHHCHSAVFHNCFTGIV